MNQRNIPKKIKATYQAKISFHRGTGPLKEWPWGSATFYRGRPYIVAGFDGGEEDNPGPIMVRLVDRMLRVELRDVDPADLEKPAAPAWSR